MTLVPRIPRAVKALLREVDRDPHARSALRTYANSVRTEDRLLARHIVDVLTELPPVRP